MQWLTPLRELLSLDITVFPFEEVQFVNWIEDFCKSMLSAVRQGGKLRRLKFGNPSVMKGLGNVERVYSALGRASRLSKVEIELIGPEELGKTGGSVVKWSALGERVVDG
jgi:hypothetical protein